MAGLKRLSGTTLIETLVAMILILISITLTFGSIINIKRSFNNDLKTFAFAVANSYLNQVDSTLKEDEIIDYKSFYIQIKREPWENHYDLYVLDVKSVSMDSTVLSEGKKILRCSKKGQSITSEIFAK